MGKSQIRVSIVVSISACHADDPGSIPGRGTFGAPIIRDCLVRRLYRRIDPPKLVFQARLAQSVERQALNLMVVGSSPTVGVCCFKDDRRPAFVD